MILIILGSLFLALCVFAALHDINRLTIPNWLNLTLAALFIPAAFVSGLPLEILGGHLLAALCAFVIAFALFAFNIFGGGDAKMIPAVMLWIGPNAAMDFLFAMALAGGACAIQSLVEAIVSALELVAELGASSRCVEACRASSRECRGVAAI